MKTNVDNEMFTLDNIGVTGTTVLITKKWTDTDGFEFHWYAENDFSTMIHSGSNYLGMPDGTYSVVGYAPFANCYSDTTIVNTST